MNTLLYRRGVAYLHRETDRLVRAGFEEHPLLYAAASGRPVRYVSAFVGQLDKPKPVYQSTLCSKCVCTERGFAHLASMGNANNTRYVGYEIKYFVAPEKVNNRSKLTTCRICGDWAFPELQQHPSLSSTLSACTTKEETTDEH